MPFLASQSSKVARNHFQGQVGVIEDRASRNGELVVAILAVEQLLLGLQLSRRSFYSAGIQDPRASANEQALAALFVGREHGVYVN